MEKVHADELLPSVGVPHIFTHHRNDASSPGKDSACTQIEVHTSHSNEVDKQGEHGKVSHSKDYVRVERGGTPAKNIHRWTEWLKKSRSAENAKYGEFF